MTDSTEFTPNAVDRFLDSDTVKSFIDRQPRALTILELGAAVTFTFAVGAVEVIGSKVDKVAGMVGELAANGLDNILTEGK